MPVLSLQGIAPAVHQSAFIAETAVIRGDLMAPRGRSVASSSD